jgi:hypothetical protein
VASEADGMSGQFVEMRGLHQWMTGAPEGIAAELIEGDQENVG